MGCEIPRRIIQIGKDLHHSLRDRAVMSNMRLLNPDFEYLFFDNNQKEEFVEQRFPQFLSVYKSFRYPIQKYDFFRYLAIYEHGGFYMDLDVLLAGSLSPLLEHGCVFSFEAISLSKYLRDDLGMDWQIGNYAFGASPRHVFLESIIENCVRGHQDTKWVEPMMRGCPPLLDEEFFVINSTGPGLVSRTFAENRELAKTVAVLFPDDVCDIRNWNRFGELGIHLMEGSWRLKRNFVHRQLAGRCWNWIQHRRIEQSRERGKSRCLPFNAIASDCCVPQ